MQDNTIYQDTVVYTWVGRDGCNWRDLRVWTGSGYAHFTQREINPGVWG